jgi:hypothetical protein
VAIACALAVALTWRSGASRILTAEGLLDGRSLWIPMLPVSAILALRASRALLPFARPART